MLKMSFKQGEGGPDEAGPTRRRDNQDVHRVGSANSTCLFISYIPKNNRLFKVKVARNIFISLGVRSHKEIKYMCVNTNSRSGKMEVRVYILL